MKKTNRSSWERFQKYYWSFPKIGMALDLSRTEISDVFFAKMDRRMQAAFRSMAELEQGAIANPDENRMVGHYWLRNAAIAPTKEIRFAIEQTLTSIELFASKVHSGKIRGKSGKFKNLLIVGIGGSALGPQFVSQALGNPKSDKLHPYFFDNTDPDGMNLVLDTIGSDLSRTLCIVISKSGGTKETRNGMLEAKAAYESHGLVFAKHAVAITGEGSELDKHAREGGWLKRFPMWDWVGGRTSELSAVGLLPAALQGLDIRALLKGAKDCDVQTRKNITKFNPAALLALAWHHATNGKGEKNMVVLPYKDRLNLLSKYLQQLVMESLGKKLDLDGRVVQQGITVLGNKGSTDQHSYVQQLRDGLNDFFATFIEVLYDQDGKAIEVETGTTTGDYLTGFLLGTRQALHEANRISITITIQNVSPYSVGAIIALYERTVGLYASLININAYHQPGVEAGKKAATTVLSLQSKVIKFLKANRGKLISAGDIAEAIHEPTEAEHIFKICEHLTANPQRGFSKKPSVEIGRIRYGIA